MFLWRGEKNVLRILFELNDWAYGLDIVKASEKRRWRERVRRGVVYVWLARLEDRKWVEAIYESDEAWRKSGGLRRRLFRLTPQGREVVSTF